MAYYVPQGFITGYIVEGEAENQPGLFKPSIRIVNPAPFPWSSKLAEGLIELKGYPGPVKTEVPVNELLKLIHTYADTPPSDYYLRTLVYINDCDIGEYLTFSGRELPEPPEWDSLYPSKAAALERMGLGRAPGLAVT